jgi:Do/DeqQ family serine protease
MLVCLRATTVLLLVSSVVVLAASHAPARAQESATQTHVDGPYAEFRSAHSPFARVAQIVSPSVVFIEVRRTGSTRRNGGPYDQFFHDFTRRGPREIPSSGSGFVMDGRGYLMTNNHVIDGAGTVSATFLNGETYACEIVGQDPRTDIAVVRITEASRDGNAFPALVLGDSDEILIGDWAIAVGNPFGERLAGTVTVGVISAKRRSDLPLWGAEDTDLQDFIQTDASINFGNSGGPLVNIRGEAIGINTALNAQGQGIGFAVPINLAASVAHQLIETGHVRRGYLGVRPAELTRAVAEGNDWEIHAGILVTDVVPDSPAEDAGLLPDDVIVEFDGRPVSQRSQFRILVAGAEVGSRVKMKVYRSGEYLDIEVTLVEYEEHSLAAESAGSSTSWLGIHVDDVGSEGVRQTWGLQAQERGVVVTEVEEDSPAAEKGVVPGSLILEIINEEIRDVSDYNRLREDLKDRRKPITLKIKEGGTVRYVALRPRR